MYMEQMKKRKRVIPISAILVLITAISKLTGFLREFVLARNFGATVEADAYLIALSIPMSIFASLMTAIVSSFIPQFNFISAKYEKRKANQFTNDVLFISIIIAIIAYCLIQFLPETSVRVIASGFTETYELMQLMVELVRISSFMMIILAISQVFSAYMQSHEKFIVATGNNIICNVLTIVAFMYSMKLGIKGLMFCSVLFSMTQIIIQYPFVRKLGFRFRPSFCVTNEIKHWIVLLFPMLISTAIVDIGFVFEKSIASTLEKGSISALNYAKKLNDLVFGIVAVSVSTIIYPKLTKLFAEKKSFDFIQCLLNGLQSILILTTPILLFVIAFPSEIIRSVYGYGNFNARAIEMTVSALIFYAPGMVIMGLRDMLCKTFFSMRDTKTPMLNGIITTVINIILAYLFSSLLGYSGLALASSLSSLFSTILLWIALRKNTDIQPKFLNKRVIMTLILALSQVAVSYFVYHTIEKKYTITVLPVIIIMGIINCLIYFGFCKKLNVSVFLQ